MVIDIIDPTDEEFQNLSNLQNAMIRAAQAKKNDILAKAEEDKEKIALKMLGNNVLRSSAFWAACEKIDAEAEADVDVVREDLLHQLAYDSYFSDGDEHGVYRYPENPNYNLNPSERFLVVRDYYMNVTQDPQARLDAYAMDSLARSYLGEFYQTLYELLASYI